MAIEEEYNHIKQCTANYTTKHLKIFALLCICCGVISSVTAILRYFNGFCYIADFLHVIIGLWQSIFMGYFQLSRLYYSFSQNQVYSSKGYSTWLFIVMFAIGFILMISYLFMALNTLSPHCGIDTSAGYIFYADDVQIVSFSWYNQFIWYSMVMVVYFLWDFVTLCLYANKIRQFRRYKWTASTYLSTNYHHYESSSYHYIILSNIHYIYYRSAYIISYV